MLSTHTLLMLAGGGVLLVYVYWIRSARIAEASETQPHLFRARCTAVVKGIPQNHWLTHVYLYENRLVITAPSGRTVLAYDDIDDIVCRFSIESLHALPWWKTLRIEHYDYDVPPRICLLMSRRKAEALLGIFREMKGRGAEAHCGGH